MNSQQLYRDIDASTPTSAQAIIPALYGLLQPATALDVGCGLGYFAAALEACGVKVTAIDGDWTPRERVVCSNFQVHDLKEPYQAEGRYDLALCLEVAEHLPSDCAWLLVDSLCRASDVILFSAAVPQQGTRGGDHLTERAPEFWDKLFSDAGYVAVRGFGDAFASDPAVAWWYWMNMVFYVKDGDPRYGTIEQTSKQRRFPTIHLDEIVPVIMTCPLNLQLTRRFAESYAASGLPAPVVSLDLTASQRVPPTYWQLLDQLAPRACYVHPRVEGVPNYESVQDAAHYVLEVGLTELRRDEQYLLFIEDDVLLSSKLSSVLTTITKNPRMAFTTLYQHGKGYGGSVVTPGSFYGTQCLLMPSIVAERLLEKRTELEKTYPPGYDIRWSRWLAWHEWLRIYCIPGKSYAQHIGTRSRLGCTGHHSEIYEP